MTDPSPPFETGRTNSPEEVLHLACSGADHRVTVRAGGLELLDHDLGGEEALLALGAEGPACLELHRAWASSMKGSREPPLFMYEGPLGERHRFLSGAGGHNPLAAIARSTWRLFGAEVRPEMKDLLTVASTGARIRRRFVLQWLIAAYSRAEPTVQDLARRLIGQIESGSFQLTDMTLVDLKELYALPKYRIGTTAWSRSELLRLMRTGLPPRDESSRHELLKEISTHLKKSEEYSRDAIGATLRHFTQKPWVLLKLLTDEGFVERRRSMTAPRKPFVWSVRQESQA